MLCLFYWKSIWITRGACWSEYNIPSLIHFSEILFIFVCLFVFLHLCIISNFFLRIVLFVLSPFFWQKKMWKTISILSYGMGGWLSNIIRLWKRTKPAIKVFEGKRSLKKKHRNYRNTFKSTDWILLKLWGDFTRTIRKQNPFK